MIDQYPPANGVLTSLIWRKTMSGGETSLSGYDNASQALSYTPGQEQVYLNGILLVRGDDYTATNGTSITGLAALSANDFVQINCYNNFSVASLPSTSITGEITNSQITSLATSKLTGTIANNQLANSSITINGSAVSLGGSTTIAGGSAQDSEPTSPTEGQLWLDTDGTLATTAFVEKSTISAKGDLYVGTANDTVGILSTTENGATLVADSSTTTGLAYREDYAAGKNKIINGDFYINQRNFTSITTSAQYGFDRWALGNVGNFGTVTYTPETFTLGAAPVAGYEGKTFARVVTTGQTQTNVLTTLRQPIESVRTFANDTVTVSFWAKAASGTPKIAVNLEQNFGTGGSPSSSVDNYLGQATLTTSWVRYSVSGSVASISGKTLGTANNDYLLATLIVSAGTDFNAKSGSLGIQSNTFDIWGVQVESGSVATAFQTATGTLAGELAACQRYYYRISKAASANLHGQFAVGSANSTTTPKGLVHFPVAMRVPPTTLDYANISCTDAGNGGTLVVTNITTGGSNGTETTQYLSGDTTDTLTAYSRVYFWGFYSTTNTKYIGWSAEL